MRTIDLESAELLEKGAAYIEEHGLHQTNYWPYVGFLHAAEQTWEAAQRVGSPVCAMGSLIIVAQGDRPATTPAVLALTRRLRTSVPAWNDTPGRTAAEVADAMRACASGLRGES